MTNAELREYVRNLYPGPKWRARVATMTDQQLVSIYLVKQEQDPDAQHLSREGVRQGAVRQ